MIRNLHFYKWFVAVIVLICSTITMSAQIKVTSISQLNAGCVIKIYPKGNYVMVRVTMARANMLWLVVVMGSH